MKYLSICFLFVTAFISTYAQNVGINTTGSAPDASSLLEIGKGTVGTPDTKGLLVPRVNLTSSSDGVTITSPATSLLVYNFGTAGLSPAGYYYNAGTPSTPNWVKMWSSFSGGGSCCSGWILKGVINSTNAGSNYFYSSTGLATAGKEYLLVGVYRIGSEITVATTDNVFLVEGTGAHPGNTDAGGNPNEITKDYGFATSVVGVAADIKKVFFCVPFLNGSGSDLIQMSMGFANFWVGLQGNGTFYLRELYANTDFGVYIFER